MVGAIVLLAIICIALLGVTIHKTRKLNVAKERTEFWKENHDFAVEKERKNALELKEAKEESGMLKKKLIEQGESIQMLNKLLQEKAKV